MATFSAQLDAFTREYQERARLIVRRSWLQLVREVVLSTPVDTGRARGSWAAGFGSPTLAGGAADPSGGFTVDRLSERFLLFGAGLWWLSSNLPYIRRLEYGWSKQAPAGMVRIAALRYAQNIDRAARALRDS